MKAATLLESDPSSGEAEGFFVEALARGLSVIRCFDQAHERLTISEVARLTGLTRATARRSLLTLSALGYMATDGKQFWLTPKILSLGHAYLSSTPLPRLLQPVLEEVSGQLHESCSASILDGEEIVYIARAATRRVISVGLGVGSRLPAYCTSMGRVLLAALAPGALEAYLARARLEPLTPYTLTDPTRLWQELAKVRAQGYALVDQELELGLRSLAVPVQNARGQVLAAMNIGVQAGRVSREELLGMLPVLRQAAASLVPLLGV
ncbi:IclR family transcriptional regulator C-terminal domain-containing protein [Meiothermus sp. CFH 77666]|uniref:IclR family transcriptional regulator domain-containing protein n=1 Tax=Meiothermus sp. CFH 77666 TaxID=2817942 RepID=UPI001AA06BF0|nr:IclR family transcriptional regulator C-terminal domain-containing protein [Meiothermus sp. CFH 77666]MBO1437408.1 helix-turn-helix domain-containing protein [Meiothermus sp. CFH 77666]